MKILIWLKTYFFWQPKRSKIKRLSIGAPSSPFISNSILFDFDTRIGEISKQLEITYTRYADDLTFTNREKNVLFQIPDLVKKEIANLAYPKLTVHNEKTVFSSKKHNRHVTGLVLTNDNLVSIGRQRKRYIRSLIFKFINNRLDHKSTLRLKGYISFARDIEPKFIDSIENKYGKEVISKINLCE